MDNKDDIDQKDLTYCSTKEKTINDCLVVCIGISKYKANIPDIPDIKSGIQEYTKVFGELYNYYVVSNNHKELYSKNALENYFKEILINYLYDINNDNVLFNGLIITISGHCDKYNLICSDGELLSFTNILSIFTQSWKNIKLSLNLPKLIIVDGHRGYDPVTHNQLNQNKNDMDYVIDTANITYSSILCSKSSNILSIHSGLLSWNICKVFQNKINDNSVIFSDIIENLKERLQKSIYKRYSITFNINEDDIDDVIFKVNKLPKRIIKTPPKLPASKPPTTAVPTVTDVKDDNPPSSVVTTMKAPPVLMKDPVKWSKKIDIISDDHDKTKIKIKWLFVTPDNISHCAILTHSQKDDPLAKSARALFIDGNEMYSKKSVDNEFTEMYQGNVLIFNIGYIDNIYIYTMKINNTPYTQSFEEWKAKQFVE